MSNAVLTLLEVLRSQMRALLFGRFREFSVAFDVSMEELHSARISHNAAWKGTKIDIKKSIWKTFWNPLEEKIFAFFLGFCVL